MDFHLSLSLVSNTPVVDIEIVPEVKIIMKIKKNLPDKYSFEFKWYRSKNRLPICRTHRTKLGEKQCIACVKSGIPIERSYHCSTDCFRLHWENHRAHHIPVPAEGDDYKINPPYDKDSCSPFDSASVSSGLSIEGGESWCEIGSSETYKPTLDDFGHRLKLQSQAVDCEGLPLTQTEVIETDHIIIAPPPCPRQMISVGSLGCFTNSSLETQPHHAVTLSILTYNLLVDYNNLPSQFPGCPTWALTWEYRRQNLLREIIQYNADILCLQEVQSDYFESFFKPELLKLGYSVSYREKIPMIFTGKNSTDGCATFFRENRFTHIETSEIRFRGKAVLAYENLSPQQKETTECHILAKENIAVIVKLKDITNGTVFCVVLLQH